MDLANTRPVTIDPMSPEEIPHQDLMAGPPPTLLPEDPAAAGLAAGDDPRAVVTQHPESPLAWAVLAEQALAEGSDPVVGYAFARVGYHRSLDLLRRNGWKGHGPVPWDHVPNRGFLRSLAALARAAEAIGEAGEVERCRQFLRDSSPEAYDALR
jgi:hypothetical protein